MGVSVTLKTKGLDLLRDKLKEINSLVLTIGFQGPSGAQLYPTGINMATVAFYNEFGTKHIPARSFLRSTMFQERDKIEKIMGEAVGRMINDRRRTPISVLRVAGAEIVALVTEKIARSRGWAKRNHDSTVAKKGFNYPLHETGKLKKAVSWAIRSGSAIGPILVQGKS
jgi:hypothetical protein